MTVSSAHGLLSTHPERTTPHLSTAFQKDMPQNIIPTAIKSFAEQQCKDTSQTISIHNSNAVAIKALAYGTVRVRDERFKSVGDLCYERLLSGITEHLKMIGFEFCDVGGHWRLYYCCRPWQGGFGGSDPELRLIPVQASRNALVTVPCTQLNFIPSGLTAWSSGS